MRDQEEIQPEDGDPGYDQVGGANSSAHRDAQSAINQQGRSKTSQEKKNKASADDDFNSLMRTDDRAAVPV